MHGENPKLTDNWVFRHFELYEAVRCLHTCIAQTLWWRVHIQQEVCLNFRMSHCLHPA